MKNSDPKLPNSESLVKLFWSHACPTAIGASLEPSGHLAIKISPLDILYLFLNIDLKLLNQHILFEQHHQYVSRLPIFLTRSHGSRYSILN